MNKIDRNALLEIAKDKQIENLDIVTYVSAVAMSKLDKKTQYPTIANFTLYKLYKNMKDKMHYINESSVNLSIKRLIERGYFGELNGDLVILNTGVGHIKSDEYFKSGGYITLHHFFFNKIFFGLPLRCKRLALYFVCRLNNDASKEELVNFKSAKNPATFAGWCEMLNINRLAHIKTALRELKKLFNIVELDNNTIRFSLNTLSKAILSGTDKLFTFTKDQVAKVEKILKEVNHKNLNFKDKHIREITEAVKDNTMKFNRQVLKELCKNSRDDVKNLLGYTKNIVKRLKSMEI